MSKQKKSLTLSIIIPVYNEERYLEDCLKSIKNQTAKADEIIVVDNNSNDNSIKIAEKYGVRIISESQQGVVFARNRGFDAAKSVLLGRIDADTILPVDWVAKIKKFYENSSHSNQSWTGGGVYRNLGLPWLVGFFYSQIAFRFNRLLLGHYILWGSNMVITKSQWQKVANDVCHDDDIHEDLDLAIHLHRKGVQITYRAYDKVSVIMRRLDRSQSLKKNLLLWPQTLRHHNIKTWVFGWIGAYFLYYLRLVAIALTWKKSQ